MYPPYPNPNNQNLDVFAKIFLGLIMIGGNTILHFLPVLLILKHPIFGWPLRKIKKIVRYCKGEYDDPLVLQTETAMLALKGRITNFMTRVESKMLDDLIAKKPISFIEGDQEASAGVRFKDIISYGKETETILPMNNCLYAGSYFFGSVVVGLCNIR